MKFNRLLPGLIFAAFFICLSSIAADAQETPVKQETLVKVITKRASATFRSENFQYKLTDADFADAPSWNEAEGEPPLSVKEAIRIARETAPRFVKGAETWKVRRVELLNLLDDKWFYRVHLTCSGAQCRDLPERSFFSIVKMNGTIIEPKRIIVEN